jgi:hypothetical protein
MRNAMQLFKIFFYYYNQIIKNIFPTQVTLHQTSYLILY